MAAPITVGELTDVPAPESPVNAQFHQETANRIIHRFASTAAMDAWAAANGSMAFVTGTGIHYRRVGAVWEAIPTVAQLTAEANARVAADNAEATARIAGDARRGATIFTTSDNTVDPFELTNIVFGNETGDGDYWTPGDPITVTIAATGIYVVTLAVRPSFGTGEGHFYLNHGGGQIGRSDRVIVSGDTWLVTWAGPLSAGHQLRGQFREFSGVGGIGFYAEMNVWRASF